MGKALLEKEKGEWKGLKGGEGKGAEKSVGKRRSPPKKF